MVPNTNAKMDNLNRALCRALRFPGKGVTPTPLSIIIKKKLVRKTDGTAPSAAAISLAASSYLDDKGSRGRPMGSNKTTKVEERAILAKFKELRPPGAYIDSRILHGSLPRGIKRKISRKTVLRRLADKGFTPQKKLNKTDLGVKKTKKRLAWCTKFKDRLPMQWKAELQGCGDFTEFTYYPKSLRSTFKRLRSSWTIMNKNERKLPKFQRPKRWFPKARGETGFSNSNPQHGTN